MTKLSIFIQCHNRPAYAKCAIESALRQTNQDFRLVISDNSSNDELRNLVMSEFPGLDYRRRSSSLTALEHFNASIIEADTEFLCLFHDDDLFEPDYVDAMLNMLELHPHAIAYSCNAEIIDDNGAHKGSSFDSTNAFELIANPRSLAGRYFSRYPNGIAPFPAYIFRTSVIKHIPIDPLAGGKYSDVAWLLEISKYGPIVWNSERLIRYRIHTTNDGGIESIRDRLRLLGYLKMNILFVGQPIINDYRFFLYKKFSKSGLTDRKYQNKYLQTFIRFLRIYRIKRFSRFETYVDLYYKLGRLLG